MFKAALVALAVLAMSPAAATVDDAPVPVIQLQGSITSGASGVGTPVSATVDCTSNPCLVTATIDGGFPVTPVALAFSGGTQTYDVPASGDACNLTYYAAGTVTIIQGTDQLTFQRTGVDSGEIGCGDGTSYQYDAFAYEVVVSLVSGSFCLIDASCPTPTPTATATPTVEATALPVEPDSGTGTSTGFESPGVLSTLPTLAESARPANALWAVALAVILVIAVALPTQLLNTAVEAGSDRVSAWFRRVRPRTSPALRPLAGWPVAAGGVLAASLIASFVDPAFGLNAASLRIFASVLVSFALDVVVGWFVVIWLVRRFKDDAAPTFRFVPATLLIVATAVLFTRLTGFEPGLVFGLVAGVVFGTLVATADRARAGLIGLGWSFAAGILGWLGYSALSLAEPSAFVVFASETLSALAIGGIAALPIALVPFRGMTGHVLWQWNRRWWALAYAVGLVGFFFVLMPMPFSWQAVQLGIWAWIGLYVLYAVFAIALWLALARPWRRDRSGDDAGAQAFGASIAPPKRRSRPT